MKNIFLIPTPKESRLWRDLDSKKLRFDNISTPNSNECTKCSNEYMYITTDSKFVRDEYITDGIEVMKATPKLVDAQGLVDRRDWKKIIITTDPELIKEGVQSIDDEFLEWFVKNPSCEEVETERFYTMSQSTYSGIEYEIIYPKKNFYCGDEVDYGEQCDFQCDRCVDATGVDYGYLPKEEPKQVISNQLKQETLEDIELEEVRGSVHCQFSVVENKLAIIYRNQLKILQAIKMLNNER